MTKREELDLFILRAEELTQSKYILADVRIANLLKSIANSKTMVAVFKNCLNEFDYEQAKKKFLVKSKFLSNEKGEFVSPTNSGELLAFTFCLLMDIDAKRVDFGEFLNKYFYEDGSFSSSYRDFIERVIKPFKNALKSIVEGVIDGGIQDPEEAFSEQIIKKEKQLEAEKAQKIQDEQLLKQSFGESIVKIKDLLLKDKGRVKELKLNEQKKEEITLAIDMLANVLTSNEKDAIYYGYVCYKYVMRAYPLRFLGSANKVKKLINVVLNEI